MTSETDLDSIYKKAVKVLALEKGLGSSDGSIHSYHVALESIATLSPEQVVEYTEYILRRGLPVSLRNAFIQQFLDELKWSSGITHEIYDKVEGILQSVISKYDSRRKYSKDEHVLAKSMHK